MNKIKNFFLKVWEWIKKAYKVCANFFRENVWASVLAIVLAILLFIVGVQSIVKAIDKCSNETSESNIENRATTITSTQLMDKINNEETFVLFLGSHNCAHCQQFYATINAYIKSGNTVYYLDVADESDAALIANYAIIVEKLTTEVPDDRGITTFATPTTVYVNKGVFADAVVGAYGMSGGEEYAKFCDVVEGVYADKPSHGLVSSSN